MVENGCVLLMGSGGLLLKHHFSLQATRAGGTRRAHFTASKTQGHSHFLRPGIGPWKAVALHAHMPWPRGPATTLQSTPQLPCCGPAYLAMSRLRAEVEGHPGAWEEQHAQWSWPSPGGHPPGRGDREARGQEPRLACLLHHKVLPGATGEAQVAPFSVGALAEQLRHPENREGNTWPR